MTPSDRLMLFAIRLLGPMQNQTEIITTLGAIKQC
jgi:hypothetical protein